MHERIERIIRHPLTIPIAVGVASFGAGVGAGYILARKTGRGAELYEIPQTDVHLTEEDLEEMDQLRQADDEGPIDKVIDDIDAELADDIHRKVDDFVKGQLEPGVIMVQDREFEAEDEEHLKVIGSPPEVTPVRRDVFAGNDDEWDYEEELQIRSDTEPYVLHRDEFYAEEKDYHQSTLTYYAGDNILVDEEEKPIFNHERTVGPLRFGHGSGDKNVFYVRNDGLRAEYEILYDTGMYTIEVLGLHIEDNQRARDLQHSHRPGKFRTE